MQCKTRWSTIHTLICPHARIWVWNAPDTTNICVHPLVQLVFFCLVWSNVKHQWGTDTFIHNSFMIIPQTNCLCVLIFPVVVFDSAAAAPAVFHHGPVFVLTFKCNYFCLLFVYSVFINNSIRDPAHHANTNNKIILTTCFFYFGAAINISALCMYFVWR